MDFQFYLKLATIILGVIGTIIAYLNFSTSSRSSLREQYKFAKEAMKDFEKEPDMHPFLKEKALQAIAGTKTIKKEEMEYILSLKDSSTRLHEFSIAKQLLVRFDNAGVQKFWFKGRYSNKRYRLVLKVFYASIYFTFASLAFSPIIFAGYLKLDPTDLVLLSLFTFLIFGFYGFVAAKAFVKLKLGESLVSNQSLLIRNIYLN